MTDPNTTILGMSYILYMWYPCWLTTLSMTNTTRHTFIVMTPPMVGSTWPRVRSTLESDCLPALSQGTALLRLVVDLLIVIFIVAAHIRCLVIGVVLVHLIDRLMFSLSYLRPWGLFSNQLSGPLTWYFVSHDGLLIMLPNTAHICWHSMGFHTLPILIATVLGLRYFSHWYDNAGQCGL